MTNIATKYMGLDLKTPIIAASSGKTKSKDSILELEEAGAGAVILKSIFEEQINIDAINAQDSAQDAMWHPEAANFIYQYSQQNEVDQYLNKLNEIKKAVSIPVIASVHCVTSAGWTDFVTRLEASGADAIELNLFVMPSNPNKTSQEIEKIYFDTVSEIKAKTKIPISLKVGYYFTSMASTLVELSKTGLDGLALFNRFSAPDININDLKVIPARMLSSKNEYVHTLRWISILADKVNCDLSATTGIHNSSTVIKQLLAGATTVQLCSTLYQDGISQFTKMNSELKEWMQKHNFETINDFKGKLSQKATPDSAAFDRVQYMKTL